ncbi:hypothetical protein AAF712_006757 [Marasmius tenuissimus]|uniref:Uncharacterized protein n=1 Tax=Marasmius tenuissimus TaxID=585030 RepID=A0ABR2ZXP5_9AGAR
MVMLDDQMRLFIFVFTVNATTRPMQTWLFPQSRGKIRCKLDYHKARLFIKFLPTIVEELGWDPTVTRLEKPLEADGSNSVVCGHMINYRPLYLVGNQISNLSTQIWKAGEVGGDYTLKVESGCIHEDGRAGFSEEEREEKRGDPTTYASVEDVKSVFMAIFTEH